MKEMVKKIANSTLKMELKIKKIIKRMMIK